MFENLRIAENGRIRKLETHHPWDFPWCSKPRNLKLLNVWKNWKMWDFLLWERIADMILKQQQKIAQNLENWAKIWRNLRLFSKFSDVFEFSPKFFPYWKILYFQCFLKLRSPGLGAPGESQSPTASGSLEHLSVNTDLGGLFPIVYCTSSWSRPVGLPSGAPLRTCQFELRGWVPGCVHASVKYDSRRGCFRQVDLLICPSTALKISAHTFQASYTSDVWYFLLRGCPTLILGQADQR